MGKFSPLKWTVLNAHALITCDKNAIQVSYMCNKRKMLHEYKTSCNTINVVYMLTEFKKKFNLSSKGSDWLRGTSVLPLYKRVGMTLIYKDE